MMKLYDSVGNARDLIESTDFSKGTNTIKFPDGTMITTGYRQYRIADNDVHTGKIEVVLKEAYVGDYYPYIMNIYSHSNTIIYSVEGSVTNDRFNVFFYSINPLKSGNSVYFKYAIIGRWK